MDIFKESHYLGVVERQIEDHSGVPQYKTKLARAAKCQASFLSQVLGKRAHLNQEHAVGLAQYWNFSALETEYFIALVNLARSATPAFTRYCYERMTDLRRRSRDLSFRLHHTDNVQEDLSVVYLSQWYICTIHLLLTIPGFNNEELIAEKLNLGRSQVRASLETLRTLGYAQKDQDEWIATRKMIHIPRSSALHGLHHSQWRRQAERAVEEQRDVVSYTATHSVSVDAIERIRQSILNMIEECRSIAFDSAEQEMIAVTCDLFLLSPDKAAPLSFRG